MNETALSARRRPSRETPTRQRVLRRFRVAFAVTALAAPPATSRAEPLAALSSFDWSADGEILAAVEDDGQNVVAVRLFDGATGAPLGEVAEDALRQAFPEEMPYAGALAVSVASGGARALLEFGHRRVLWTAATGAFVALDRVADGTSEATLAPDGRWLSYLAGSDLWVLDMDSGEPSRLAAGVLADPEPAWSPDGRALAFATRDENGGTRLAVVQTDRARAPLLLDTDPLGAPLRFQWRFDANALGVVGRLATGELSLGLCHPVKSYCRPLARRNAAAATQVDDFRFLEDGFLWGPSRGDAALALYDTLGRERRAVVPLGARWLGIAAVFAETDEVVIARADDAGVVRLLLVRLHGGEPREIASAPGRPPVEISETLRAWVRPEKDAADHVVGYLMERIDGTPILTFTPAGAPARR